MKTCFGKEASRAASQFPEGEKSRERMPALSGLSGSMRCWCCVQKAVIDVEEVVKGTMAEEWVSATQSTFGGRCTSTLVLEDMLLRGEKVKILVQVRGDKMWIYTTYLDCNFNTSQLTCEAWSPTARYFDWGCQLTLFIPNPVDTSGLKSHNCRPSIV